MTDRFKLYSRVSRSAATNPNTPYQAAELRDCDDLIATKEKVGGYSKLKCFSPTPIKQFKCLECEVDKPVKRKPAPSKTVEKLSLMSQRTSVQLMLEGEKGAEFFVLRDLNCFDGLKFDEKLDRSHNDNDCPTGLQEVAIALEGIRNEIIDWLTEKEAPRYN